MLFNQNANGGEVDEAKEGNIGLVVASSYTTKPFDFLEETLYQVSFFV